LTSPTSGFGIPVYADIPPASWAYNTAVPKYTLDVAGAKTLIESSGWALGSDGIYAKAGKKLSTTLYVRQASRSASSSRSSPRISSRRAVSTSSSGI